MQPADLAKSGTEHGHQCAVFAWAALNVGKWPCLEWMYAVKNAEASGSAIRGARAKAEGVKAGVSDICLPFAAHGMHGLYIEMKKPGGKPRPDQIKFGEYLHKHGYGFVICDTWEKAIEVLSQYLS